MSSSIEAFSLIIDGKSLTYALEDDTKRLLLDLAIGCTSFICHRSSPKQKVLVTRFVKFCSGKTTLAIGDGANDVGMLEETDARIGIGISSVKGMQRQVLEIINRCPVEDLFHTSVDWIIMQNLKFVRI